MMTDIERQLMRPFGVIIGLCITLNIGAWLVGLQNILSLMLGCSGLILSSFIILMTRFYARVSKASKEHINLPPWRLVIGFAFYALIMLPFLIFSLHGMVIGFSNFIKSNNG